MNEGIKYFLLQILLCISILSFAQKAELIIPKGHTNPISELAIDANQQWLASTQGNSEYTIWNLDSEKEIRHLNFHEMPIEHLLFHPDYPSVISVDKSGRLVICDYIKNRKRSDLKLHDARVHHIEFSKDNQSLWSLSENKTFSKTNYQNLEKENEFKLDFNANYFLNLNDQDVIFVGEKGTIASFEGNEKKKNINLSSKQELIFISKTAEGYVTISKMGKVFKLNSDFGIIDSLKFDIRVRDIHENNENLYLIAKGEKEFVEISKDAFEPKEEWIEFNKELDVNNIGIQCLSGSIDSLLILPNYSFGINVYNTDTKKLIRSLKGQTEKIMDIDFSGDGRFMAIAGIKNGVRIYDLKEIYEPFEFKNGRAFYSIDFTEDDKKLYATSRDSLFILSFPEIGIIQKVSLENEFPEGNTGFAGKYFVKKEKRDGLSLFDTKSNNRMLIEEEGTYIFSANETSERIIIKSGLNNLICYELSRLKKKKKKKLKNRFSDFCRNENSKEIFLLRESEIEVLEEEKLKSLRSLKLEGVSANKIMHLEGENLLALWSTRSKKGSGKADYGIWLVNAESSKVEMKFSGPKAVINEVRYYEDQKKLIAASNDGTVWIWSLIEDKQNIEYPVSFLPLENKDFAVIDKSGLFDASRPAFKQMHFVQGAEYVSLDQLKEEYYEPHLLSKVFGFNTETVRSRDALGSIELYPEIDLIHPNRNSGVLGIDLKDQGGGIGEIYIWINGKKALSTRPENTGDKTHYSFNISDHPYLQANEINTLSVRAGNAQGNVISQEKKLRVLYNKEEAQDTSQKFYAIVIGVSDYKGKGLDLAFSSKDALNISDAIKNGAINKYGAQNVEIKTLTSEGGDGNPAKENISTLFKSYSKLINPKDVFLFYFAGHGMQGKADPNRFYLLTEEAGVNETRKMLNPGAFAISDLEISEWIGSISSHNNIMIMDACHSGSFINNLNQNVDHFSSSEVRTMEKLMDETGMYILAGSESDKVSYETHLYGQGLLTYSLLYGMKGEALREGEYLDVSNLFQYASGTVPELAERIGGVQRPEIKIPGNSERIDIGRYGSEEKKSIQLISPRPVILPTSFQENTKFRDIEDIGLLLDEQLKEEVRNQSMDITLYQSRNFKGAYEIRGRYLKVGTATQLDLRIFRGDEQIQKKEFLSNDLKTMIDDMSTFILESVRSDFSGIH